MGVHFENLNNFLITIASLKTGMNKQVFRDPSFSQAYVRESLKYF